MKNNIEDAFLKFKKAKEKYNIAKQTFLIELPESVQLTYHYDGLEGVRHWHPDYYNYLKELRSY